MIGVSHIQQVKRLYRLTKMSLRVHQRLKPSVWVLRSPVNGAQRGGTVPFMGLCVCRRMALASDDRANTRLTTRDFLNLLHMGTRFCASAAHFALYAS